MVARNFRHYCLSWAVLTNFQRTARHRHFPRLPPCRCRWWVTSIRPKIHAKNSKPSMSSLHPSNVHSVYSPNWSNVALIKASSESHVRMTIRLILLFIVPNSPLVKQRSLMFCLPQRKGHLYVLTDWLSTTIWRHDGVCRKSGKSFLNMTSRKGQQLDPS